MAKSMGCLTCRGIVVEITDKGPVHYGVKEHLGQTIKIANLAIPVTEIGGADCGIIRKVSIEYGRIEFKLVMKDTPDNRKRLGIGSLLGMG